MTERYVIDVHTRTSGRICRHGGTPGIIVGIIVIAVASVVIRDGSTGFDTGPEQVLQVNGKTANGMVGLSAIALKEKHMQHGPGQIDRGTV